MSKRHWLPAALLAASLGSIALPAAAETYVNVAPPEPRYEVVPTPRHGFVWAPGYWDWRHGHYVWVKGHWEREHHGMYWHPHRWEQVDGRWVMREGGWHRERYAMEEREEHHGMRDRDRDGVPDRYDRAPDNPYRQ